MNDICHIFILCHERYDLRLCEHGTHTGDHHIVLPFQTSRAHLLQGKSQCSRHHLQETSRSGRTFIVHQEVLDRAVLIDADRLDVLSADVDDSADIRIQIMGAFRMAGDLRDAVITTVDVGTSVSCRINADDLFLFNSRFLHGQLQALLRAHGRSAAGRDDHRGLDLSVLIQDHNIGTCGSAVNSRYIINS